MYKKTAEEIRRIQELEIEGCMRLQKHILEQADEAKIMAYESE